MFGINKCFFFWFCFKNDSKLQITKLIFKTLSNDVLCGSWLCGLFVENVWMLFIDILEEINNQLCCSNECTALPLTFESDTALTSTLLLYNMGCCVNQVCAPNILSIIPNCAAFRACPWVWRLFISLLFLWRFCTFHLYRSVSYILCIGHWSCALCHPLMI